jgi:hypothetical protein
VSIEKQSDENEYNGYHGSEYTKVLEHLSILRCLSIE